MSKGYAAKISKRISNADAGSVFLNSDFTDIADPETVRRNLNRLVEAGNLRRIINGVYEKPAYSEFLKETIAVSPDNVAKAVARNYHWTIAPCGNTALNLLGLSAQVPAVWAYVSDGPYRSYKWDGGQIEFRHRTNREISGLSYMSALVVQALKSLGKGGVTEKTVEILRKRLSGADKKALLKETAQAADWVVETVREICGEQ